MEGPLILMDMSEILGVPDVVQGKLNYIRANCFHFSTGNDSDLEITIFTEIQ